MSILSGVYARLKRFKISLYQALLASNLKCFYRRDRAFKRYQIGVEHLEKHLDIVRLIKMSMGFETLMKVQL